MYMIEARPKGLELKRKPKQILTQREKDLKNVAKRKGRNYDKKSGDLSKSKIDSKTGMVQSKPKVKRKPKKPTAKPKKPTKSTASKKRKK